MKAALVVALSLLVSSVVAQGGQPDIQERFRSADRALQNTTAEVEDLIDLRMRHDLGLVAELDDSLVRVEKPMTPRQMVRQRSELSQLTKETDYFRGEYEKLRAKVKLLNEAAMAAGNPADQGQVIPSIGSAIPRQPQSTKPINNQTQQMPAAPSGEMSSSRVGRADLGSLALDPLQAQIHGSKDHLRVAQALFKVGQALMDRGQELRQQGRLEAAKELDDRAKTRLERALKELKPLTSEQEPAYVVLFYLGRCRELMFRYSERHENLALGSSDYGRRRQLVREPFLQISARDVKNTGPAGAVEVLGSWGQAAKAAMEHFRWMNTNASYDASVRIDALTWPGEDRQ